MDPKSENKKTIQLSVQDLEQVSGGGFVFIKNDFDLPLLGENDGGGGASPEGEQDGLSTDQAALW